MNYKPEQAFEAGKQLKTAQEYQDKVRQAHAHYSDLIEKEVGDFEAFSRETTLKIASQNPADRAKTGMVKAEENRSRKQEKAEKSYQDRLAIIQKKEDRGYSGKRLGHDVIKEKEELKKAENELQNAEADWNSVKNLGPAWSPKLKVVVVLLIALGEFASNLPAVNQFNPDIPPIAGIKPIYFVALLALILTAASMFCAEFVGEHIKQRKFDVMTLIATVVALGFGVAIALARATHIEQAQEGAGPSKLLMFIAFLALYLLFATVSAVFGYNSVSSAGEKYYIFRKNLEESQEKYEKEKNELQTALNQRDNGYNVWLENLADEKRDAEKQYEAELAKIDEEYQDAVGMIDNAESNLRDALLRRKKETTELIISHSQTLKEWQSNFERGANQSHVGIPRTKEAKPISLKEFQRRIEKAATLEANS